MKTREETVWVALADPTRRQILDLLRAGPRTLGDLTDQFPTSRFAIRKHLNVLEQSGLVVVRWQGRERWNHLNVVPLQDVYERWVTPYQRVWATRLSRFRKAVEGGSMTAAAPTPATLLRVELEIEIAAPAKDVWRALTEDTTRWWPKDFYTGPATGFHMEPRLGGRLYEDWGDGAGVIWYEIFAINPGTSIDLQGSLAVPYGAGTSLLHLELAQKKRTTVLKVSDVTIGAAGDATEKTKGWETIFRAGLKRHVERTS